MFPVCKQIIVVEAGYDPMSDPVYLLLNVVLLFLGMMCAMCFIDYRDWRKISLAGGKKALKKFILYAGTSIITLIITFVYISQRN